MKLAVAVFVKTPDLSPFKTRLAKSIGKEATKEFYLKSILATKELATSLLIENNQVRFFWAVAEEKGLTNSLWSNENIIYQGEGGLSSRLSKVYNELLQNHDSVILLGADSPHLYSTVLSQHISKFLKNDSDFLIGRSFDGGFYFFQGKIKIAFKIWDSVNYSSKTTIENLAREISKIGDIIYLSDNFDVDELSDLLLLKSIDESDLLTEQKKIIKWVKSTILPFIKN